MELENESDKKIFNEKTIKALNRDPQDENLLQLKELTETLLQSMQNIQIQNARNSKIDEAISEVKASARALYANPANGINYSPVENKNNCSSENCSNNNCGCTSNSCCCFEIVLSKVRAAKPQIEPADMGDIPGLINALEVQIYATNENIGFLWPGLATTMDLRADGAPGGPGPWVVIERVINKIYVKKGSSLTTEINIEVREHDEGVERPIGFKDEVGEGSGLIILDCCMSKIYPQMPIDIPLIFGGEGRGMVQVAYYARRIGC